MESSQQISALNSTQSKLLHDLLVSLSDEQKIWLGGYLTGLNESTRNVLSIIDSLSPGVKIPKGSHPETGDILTILYGTRSGNAQKVAKIAMEIAHQSGVNSQLINLVDYNPKNIKKEKHVLIVVSTDGEGDPPVAAEEFYNYIMGKKAPKLEGLQYSVLALGDKSYLHFCKIGRDIDKRFSELGATSFAERVDCDIDFEDDATKWAETSIKAYAEMKPASKTIDLPTITSISSSAVSYSKKYPYKAQMLDRINLNGKGSGKSTYHIEFDLEDSGLSYTPGDALAVVCINDEKLVDAVLKTTKLNEESVVKVGSEEKYLKEALVNDFEITTITPQVVKSYAETTNNKDLISISKDKAKLSDYIYGRDIVDLLEEYPSKISPHDLTNLLRKLQPRLYSIASSYNANPDEVHLTVGAVEYKRGERNRFGVCSNFLADIPDDQLVSVYVDENISFRLPQDSSTPIIMVGAGTGIAPYRAFMQERVHNGINGNSWLFFGDRNFTTDFLYQIEWQKYLKNNHLSKMDVAFSRDQKDKVYVQHKLLDNKKEIFKWIENGANIYVCGDKNTMANDVKEAFRQIVISQAGYNEDKAAEYIKDLRKQNRYHEDVY